MRREARLGRLPRFSTIGFTERHNLYKAMHHPLSGYLGGNVRAGYWCERLADEWQEAFKVKYAVPCNSATSGLMAACMAAKIGPGDIVWTTALSMSATAACAKVLGARIVFIDIETIRYSMNMNHFTGPLPKCVIVANLFGHPAYLSAMRSWCDSNKVIMIEDNAQSPFAMEGGKYAGTIGHMGVFSLNVHKHIQCGEGGVVVTNDGEYSLRLRCAINHGELANTAPQWIGLNLRMTEPIAAIACAQLARAPKIIEGRRDIAHAITEMFSGVPWLLTPIEDVECRHVYYMWCARVMNGQRRKLVMELNAQNFPIREGYSKPLNRIFANQSAPEAKWDPPDGIVYSKKITCPVAERLEDEEFISYEVCVYDPKSSHLKKMGEIAKRAIETVEGGK